ncbi:MAG: LysR family transcriptional regulator [Elstera sp.]
MRLRHIEVFHAIIVTGTVSGAARVLNVSQPAVTKILQHAEDQIGLTLFQRIRGRLHPTPEGLALFAEVQKIYSGLESLKKLARNLKDGRTGRLRIAASPALCIDLMPQAIARFRKEHPDVSFEVETHHYKDLVDALLVQDVDLGFAFDATPHPGLSMDDIASGAMVAIFQKGTANHLASPVDLTAMTGWPFIGLRAGDPLGALLHNALNVSDIALMPEIEVKTNRIALSLVSRGAGAAIVDSYTAASDQAELVDIKALREPLTYRVQALWARHKPQSVLARQFIQTFIAVERESMAALNARLS